jgi:Holliday junction resolvase RusA-like endonuclease
MIKFTISGNPKIKKNNRTIYINKSTGNRFIGKSKRLQLAENYYHDELLSQLTTLQYQSLYKYNFPLTDILEIEYKFYRGDKRKCDLSNLLELPNDCLQSAGIIADDCQIHKIIAYKYYDKEARTEIIIKLIKE